MLAEPIRSPLSNLCFLREGERYITKQLPVEIKVAQGTKSAVSGKLMEQVLGALRKYGRLILPLTQEFA